MPGRRGPHPPICDVTPVIVAAFARHPAYEDVFPLASVLRTWVLWSA